ncbi:MAG: polyprenol phosphomannose-dependent alpha 1,6 mannosyltransferase MptB [Streptosporangiales bacterium]|nr:polyprenol phosphomannose-dependent alpha 1,6 mannosyltransferase MptB [Streptosporangiales bacterium]
MSLAGIAVSVGLAVVVGAAGPSVAEPPLGPPTGWPPYAAGGGWPTWIVVWLLAAATALGGVSLGLALVALRRGWQPDARRLVAASVLACVALVLVPPMGSADHLSYAAYGRMATRGLDPYYYSPYRVMRGGDPIAKAVEPPWLHTTSVYGPVATAEQALASWLGGTSVRMTVFALAVLNALAFLLAGSLLYVATRGDPARRSRAAVLWSVNPLLLYAGVAGAHVDVLMVAALIGATLAVRRSGLLAGLLLGIAMAVKLPAALGAAGIAWAFRRRLESLFVAAAASLAVVATAYALAGPYAFDQISRASKYISLATPGRLPLAYLDEAIGPVQTRLVLRLAGIVALAVVTVLLLRWAHRRFGPSGTGPLPAGPVPDDPAAAADERLRLAVWVTGAFAVAWLFTAPYALPWYDALGWAFLALLPSSRLDALFLFRGVVLALAYVPGRVELPKEVAHVTLQFRAHVAPYLTLAVLVAVVVVLLAVPGRTRLPAAPTPK